jgi:predicted dienelactone hydrolase
MTEFSAAPPIEPPRHPIGRRTTLVADPQRDGRLLGVDVWYPAAVSDGPRSEYELFPGVSFVAAAAQHEPPPAPGPFPLIVFSHGRTGMRFAYSLLCEALAARGAIVVSADHPGDGLTDWLLGSHVDDRTNEINRVGDAHALLAELQPGGTVLPAELIEAIDHDRVALAGHSYGAYTALATSAGARGVPAHDRVRAVVGLQPYTRSMSDGALGRVTVPALLVVSEQDTTTPASTDADRPWALLRGKPTWRVDVAGAGHQAASDMGLYSELARNLPGLPQIARDYLEASAADSVGPGLRPWRQLLATQIGVVWAFLQVTLDLDIAVGIADARRLGSEPDVTLRVR